MVADVFQVASAAAQGSTVTGKSPNTRQPQQHPLSMFPPFSPPLELVETLYSNSSRINGFQPLHMHRPRSFHLVNIGCYMNDLKLISE